MERIAIPIWQGRISPVLDTAGKLWIFDLNEKGESEPRIVEIPSLDFRRRVDFFESQNINTLICGAISRPLYNLLINLGIAVRPWLTGTVEDVLAAYKDGKLDLDYFRLPGCRRQRQRGRFRRGNISYSNNLDDKEEV